MSNNYDFDKTIFKMANKSMIFAVSDNTNDEWDVEGYNNVVFKFVQYDNNKNTQKYLPIYVDADELKAVLSQIVLGTFEDFIFNTDRGFYISYGGSKSGGLAKQKQGGKLQPIIKGKPESRILKMKYDKSGNFYIVGESYNGKIIRNGAITKANNDPVLKLFFKLDRQNALIMAQTIIDYLKARQVISLSKYYNEKTKALKAKEKAEVS